MTVTARAFSCSAASAGDLEPMAGTAPTETDYLFLEHPGPWGRKALAEARLPERLRARLDALDGVRVQLIRRPRERRGGGIRVFAATLGETPVVTTALLGDLEEVAHLDTSDLEPYAGPLWFVCTNGRRDVCCATLGRPVASALAAQWPEATWETTHLGGHRFSGTLLALPSGVALGRLDAATAVEACRDLEHGRLPAAHARGRAGRSGPAQVADLHVREALGLDRLDEVVVEGTHGDTVRVRALGTAYDVTVTTTAGEPRRQSCADLTTKAAPVFTVTTMGTHQAALSPTTRRIT